MDKFKQLLAWVFSTTANAGITPLRVVVGLIMAVHGWDKIQKGMDTVAGGFGNMGIPFPYLNAILASYTEFLGGVALILGIGTRLVAIPVGFTMVVACVTAHWGALRMSAGGMEYPLSLLAANIAFVFLGAGPLAIDALIAKKGLPLLAK